MIFKHRINGIRALSKEYQGVELDLRYHNGEIVISHDLVKGSFIPLKSRIHELKGYKVIANIKESGIEDLLIDIFERNNIDYYFLDSQLPDIIRLSKNDEYKSRFILRISDLEDINDNLINLVKPKFIWVDYSKFDDPQGFDQKHYIKFIKKVFSRFSRNNNYSEDHRVQKIIVSPDLYGIPESSIDLSGLKSLIEAVSSDYSVCTKNVKRWDD